MEYALELKNICKAFKHCTAVHNLNMKVPEGKIYGFLGKNGAGKTTTIKIIMGLITPERGEILIQGQDARKNRKTLSRRIGAIIENPGFYENLSATSNLRIASDIYMAENPRVDELLELVQLKNTGSKKLKDFSLGMKQRLGIAQTLVHNPHIIILDEPANGLDPEGIREMRATLRNLSSNRGITTLISSHILSEIEQIADHIGIIDQGKMILEDSIGNIRKDEQTHLILETGEPEIAAAELEKRGFKFNVEAERFTVWCQKDQVQEINKYLVLAGASVSHLASAKSSLEDNFFSIIG